MNINGPEYPFLFYRVSLSSSKHLSLGTKWPFGDDALHFSGTSPWFPKEQILPRDADKHFVFCDLCFEALLGGARVGMYD